jgi:predicted acylesterase/phospholipase RssA
MARQPIAFVISGGGSQGSFECGVLRFLYDELHIRPSILCGISVGSIIAAKLAEGDDEEAGRRAIDDVEDIWRGLRSNDDMWVAEPWLEKLRSQVAWASELRERAGEHGTAGSQTRVVLRMLGNIVRNPPETDGTIDALRQALRAQSLMSMEPVRKLLAEHVHPERIATSGIKLRMGTVSLESGELRYVTETGALHARDDTPTDLPDVDITEGVLASAAIPVVFPPVPLGEEHYVDGGVREILPLELAFRHLGAGHMFAVVASTPGVEPMGDFGSRGLLDIARRVSADIGTDETLRKEIDPPRGWGRRVTLIAPELDVHDALVVDPALIAASIDYGWMRAADVLLGLPDEDAALSAEIARARADLRLAEGPVVGFLGEEPVEMSPPADAGDRSVDGLRRRVEELVERRRAAGAPLPPSGCEPVTVEGPVVVGQPGAPVELAEGT